MKKIVFFTPIILVILLGSFQNSYAGSSAPVGIGITFSSKAYWDNTTKSCEPRDKGCCFHIEINLNVVTLAPGQIIGTLEQSKDGLLTFSFSTRTGILTATLMTLCKHGMFTLDGTGTFSDEILKKFSLPPNFTLPPGEYPYVENGDVIMVSFKY